MRVIGAMSHDMGRSWIFGCFTDLWYQDMLESMIYELFSS